MAGTTAPSLAMHDLPTGLNPVVIQADTSGALDLVAAATGKTVDVYGLMLTASGATTVQIQSGATETKLNFSLVAGIPVFLPLPVGSIQGVKTRVFPYCQSNDGEKLNIAWSGSVTLTGVVYTAQRLTAAI